MPDRFKNPPLIELMAELRWGPGGVPAGATGAGQVVMTNLGQYEEFFTRFGSRVAALGFERIERLVPHGFAVPAVQAVYRFRRKAPEQGTAIYQVGTGVFSTNITPPYHSWAEFRPVVKEGVECLLETRNAAEHQMPFAQVVLRYLDAFTSKFTQGHTVASFIRDVLGFEMILPNAIKLEVAQGQEVKPLLQLSAPLKSGRHMNMVLAEGIVNTEQAIVMDLSVINGSRIAPNVANVMASFDQAHDVIHRVFVGITAKLFPIMEPIEGEGE